MSPTSIVPAVSRFQSDLGSNDNATAQTVEIMCQHIKRACEDPAVQRAALNAVQRFRGNPWAVAAGEDPLSPKNVAQSAWWYAKHRLKFEHHEKTIRLLFGENDQLQLLISPEIIERLSNPKGDCAIYVMLVCAILRCFGVPYEVVTIACNPSEPGIFSHVFCYAVMPDGTRLPLDASHGKVPGWQVPYRHRTKTQVWDESGNPVQDYPAYSGLGAYVRQAKGYRPRALGFFRGLGQDDDDTYSGDGVVDIGDTSSSIDLNQLPTSSNLGNELTGTLPIYSNLPSENLSLNELPGLPISSNLSSNELTSTLPISPQLSSSSNLYSNPQLPSSSDLTNQLGGAGTTAATTPTYSSNPLQALANVLSGAVTGAETAFVGTKQAQANAGSIAAWTPILMIGGLVVAGILVISLLKK